MGIQGVGPGNGPRHEGRKGLGKGQEPGFFRGVGLPFGRSQSVGGQFVEQGQAPPYGHEGFLFRGNGQRRFGRSLQGVQFLKEAVAVDPLGQQHVRHVGAQLGVALEAQAVIGAQPAKIAVVVPVGKTARPIIQTFPYEARQGLFRQSAGKGLHQGATFVFHLNKVETLLPLEGFPQEPGVFKFGRGSPAKAPQIGGVGGQPLFLIVVGPAMVVQGPKRRRVKTVARLVGGGRQLGRQGLDPGPGPFRVFKRRDVVPVEPRVFHAPEERRFVAGHGGGFGPRQITESQEGVRQGAGDVGVGVTPIGIEGEGPDGAFQPHEGETVGRFQRRGQAREIALGFGDLVGVLQMNDRGRAGAGRQIDVADVPEGSDHGGQPTEGPLQGRRCRRFYGKARGAAQGFFGQTARHGRQNRIAQGPPDPRRQLGQQSLIFRRPAAADALPAVGPETGFDGVNARDVDQEINGRQGAAHHGTGAAAKKGGQSSVFYPHRKRFSHHRRRPVLGTVLGFSAWGRRVRRSPRFSRTQRKATRLCRQASHWQSEAINRCTRPSRGTYADLRTPQ